MILVVLNVLSLRLYTASMVFPLPKTLAKKSGKNLSSNKENKTKTTVTQKKQNKKTNSDTTAGIAVNSV